LLRLRPAIVALLACAFPTLAGVADILAIDGTTISLVHVNGGSDTSNPGTTCIQVATGTDAACAAALIAIPNNNKPLLTTVLMAKTLGLNVRVDYDRAAALQHCPNWAFTPCSLVNVQLK